MIEAKYQEMFSIVHSSSHRACKSQSFILWKIRHGLLAFEHIDVCLHGHSVVKTHSCGPIVTAAEISRLLGKYDGQKFCSEWGRGCSEKESLFKKSQKLIFIPTCFMQNVTLVSMVYTGQSSWCYSSRNSFTGNVLSWHKLRSRM